MEDRSYVDKLRVGIYRQLSIVFPFARVGQIKHVFALDERPERLSFYWMPCDAGGLTVCTDVTVGSAKRRCDKGGAAVLAAALANDLAEKWNRGEGGTDSL